MTDAFISYSRRDKDFVRRLHDQLKAQDRDIWIDWDDIPPASDWRAYIKTGIEEANAVIFVISPDSARSKECRVEVDMALESGKRFIPIMRRMVDDPADQAQMHPLINSHNWVYLRDEDNFEEGVGKLLSAMDTDLEYVRAHTRLLVRAGEWQQNKRDGSLTLRGSDLADAEAWLANGVTKQPAPTPLQSEYVKISRQAESARSRRLLAGAGVAVVISVALAVMAFIQWQNAANNLDLANVRGTEVRFQAATSDSNAVIAEQNAVTAIVAQGIAEDQRATAYARGTDVANSAGTAVAAQGEAERQALIARGAALASQAQLQVEEGRPEVGLLLALEVLKNYPYTSQAEFALSSAVQKVRPSQIYPSLGNGFGTVDFSPDGKFVAVPNEDNTVTIWNVDANQAVWDLVAHQDSVSGVAWSPDGAYLATVSAFEAEVYVWDVATGEPQAQFEGYAALWSPDSTRILTQLDDTYVEWNALTGEELLSVNATNLPVITPPMDWSPDSRFIVAGDMDGTVKIWDASDGEVIYTLEAHESRISAVSWSPDGTQLYTASGDTEDDPYQPGDASTRLWDMQTGELLWTYDDLPVAMLKAEWTADSQQFFTTGLDYTVRIWDASAGQPVLQLPGFEADWSADNDQIVTSNLFDGSARVWDATTGTELAVLAGQNQGIPYVQWSPDGSRIATSSIDATVRVWDMRVQRELISIPSGGASWLPDSSGIYSLNPDFTTTIGILETGKSEVISESLLAVSPDTTRGLVAADDGLFIVELQTGQVLMRLSGLGDLPPSIADWSEDGKMILAADADGNMFTWNAVTGEAGRQYTGNFGLWSPDSSRLLTFSYGFMGGDESVTMWDTATGAELHRFSPADSSLINGAWSRDGKQVMLSFQLPEGASILIYDAVTGVEQSRFPGIAMDWAPDGRRMVVVNQNGSVSIRDAQTRALLMNLDVPGESMVEADWSPNGEMLLTLTADGEAKVWRTWPTLESLESFAEECCVVRELTAAERVQFGLGAE